MASQEQMHFDGSAGCPRFAANPFKRDICQVCQNKIQAHDAASEGDISAAIEYAADQGRVYHELSLMKATAGIFLKFIVCISSKQGMVDNRGLLQRLAVRWRL